MTIQVSEMKRDYMNILIVDDDVTDARLLQELFSEVEPPAPYVVHEEKLATACQRLQEERFDIVLLDFFLPGSQGIESLSVLREQAPEVPIIFLTGLQDDELSRKMMEFGAQGYVVKGQLGGKELLHTLREVIARYQAKHS